MIINDSQLVEQAVKRVHNKPHRRTLMFDLIIDIFGCDAPFAVKLCERFGYDPYENVDRRKPRLRATDGVVE